MDVFALTTPRQPKIWSALRAQAESRRLRSLIRTLWLATTAAQGVRFEYSASLLIIWPMAREPLSSGMSPRLRDGSEHIRFGCLNKMANCPVPFACRVHRAGLQGIEAYHRHHEGSHSAVYLNLVRRFDLPALIWLNGDVNIAYAVERKALRPRKGT